MKIWIGCDHAGYERKQEVIALLKERQLEVEDCGCNGERADYPVIAKAVGTAVASHPGDMGILICGTGIGMSIAANKIRGIRASLCARCVFHQVHPSAQRRQCNVHGRPDTGQRSRIGTGGDFPGYAF